MPRKLGKGWKRDGKGRVVIQVHNRETHRTEKVPRALYRFLDRWDDDAVTAWVSDYRERNRAQAGRTMKRFLSQTEPAQVLFDKFLEERTLQRRLEGCTVMDEQGRWANHIVPFFVGKHEMKDLVGWHSKVYDLTTHLLEAGDLEVNQQKKVLRLLENFGRFLAAKNVIDRPWTVIYPSGNVGLATPLEVALLPAQVLAYAAGATPEAAMLALLGFFACLRAEETFALKKEDFLLGARTLSGCLTYRRLQERKLGSLLSVSVSRALRKTGLVGKPKTVASTAVVNVWNPEAARMLAAIVRELPAGYLFPGKPMKSRPKVDRPLSRETLFLRWADGRSTLGVTLHDLRRASGFYLGRTHDLPITLLQDMLRHADLKSCEMYMRAPRIEPATKEEQDWDSVG